MIFSLLFKIRDVEGARDAESRRCVEAQKGLKKVERRAKDLETELFENMRTTRELRELSDKQLHETRKMRQQYEETVSFVIDTFPAVYIPLGGGRGTGTITVCGCTTGITKLGVNWQENKKIMQVPHQNPV